MKIEVPSWDDVWMTQLYGFASRSKDLRTHIGAIVVGPDHRFRSSGYNSFPGGINDFVSERQEKGEKDYWMAHAEENAIANAARVGVSLYECIMYTNGIPCMKPCARLIVNSGIKEVVVDNKWNSGSSQKRLEHNRRTIQLFNEAGVNLRYHDTNYVKFVKMNDGIITPLE